MAGTGERRDSDGGSGACGPGPLSRLLQELLATRGDDALEAWKSELQPGDRLGRFEIRRAVGHGGFGSVYEAFDTELKRIVAVKTLRLSRARRDLSADWLQKEAEAVARLEHPCIVTLHDVGTCASGPYLVMELLHGKTLAQRIAEGPLPPSEALRVAEEMAKGLAHAHQRGVLHRDLKPANVFLCEDGRVKLLDFGLAHLLGTRAEHGAGTPAYMAPEQARGGRVDQRADVYAAGKVLDEMLGDRRPSGLARAIVSATSAEPAARPRDGQAWLDLLQSARRVVERPSRVRRVALLAGAGLVVGSVAAGFVVHRSSHPPEGAPASATPSIAVLPFDDMSPGRDQEFLADGIAEEILNALARLDGLKVIARTSSFSFKGKGDDAAAIAGRLKVAYLLEGSVRRDGGRVRISAKLVNARDGIQVWAESFDREVTGVLDVQDEIARAVVESLKVKLIPGTRPSSAPRRAVHPEAYSQYLLGLQHMRGEDSERGLRMAAGAFENAIALDSDHAPAWAGLSWALAYLSNYAETQATRAALLERSSAAAERSISLDPLLPGAYLARSRLRLYAWEWSGAQADVDRALELDPNSARGHSDRGYLHEVMDHSRDALASFRRALDLDPLDHRGWARLALPYRSLGDMAGARTALARSRDLAPDDPYVNLQLAVQSLLEGQAAVALAEFEQLPEGRWRSWGVALARHSLGQEARARWALDGYKSRFGNSMAYQIALIHAWRGERDDAFDWLDRACDMRDGGLVFAKRDLILRPLRDDPRFPALLRRLNLPVD